MVGESPNISQYLWNQTVLRNSNLGRTQHGDPEVCVPILAWSLVGGCVTLDKLFNF